MAIFGGARYCLIKKGQQRVAGSWPVENNGIGQVQRRNAPWTQKSCTDTGGCWMHVRVCVLWSMSCSWPPRERPGGFFVDFLAPFDGRWTCHTGSYGESASATHSGLAALFLDVIFFSSSSRCQVKLIFIKRSTATKPRT